MSDVATIEPKVEEAPKPKAQHNTMKFDAEVPCQPGMEKVPRPQFGMPVLFYEGGDRDSRAALAFITGCGMASHTVDLSVVSPSFGTLQPKDAVHHVNDIPARASSESLAGTWDHHPWMRKLLG